MVDFTVELGHVVKLESGCRRFAELVNVIEFLVVGRG